MSKIVVCSRNCRDISDSTDEVRAPMARPLVCVYILLLN
jgi:hypothetical protein